MNAILVVVLQFFASLSLLVVVHEFGHFISARLFKVRVEKFYLFFNPWFSLYKYKPKNSDTEYGIGWLPLGGYVKIAGMIDESMDKEQMALPPKPDEFRSKPAGQRLVIMVAGVVMNFVMALLIYSMVLFTWGDTYLPTQNAKMGMEFSPVAEQLGFRSGDILVAADGIPFERYNEHTLRQISSAKKVEVLRQNTSVFINIPEDFMVRLMAGAQGFASYRIPVIVDEVSKGSSAEAAGLTAGDSIYAVNDTVQTFTLIDFKNQANLHKSQPIKINFYRNGVASSCMATPDTAGIVGFSTLYSPLDIYKTVTKEYGFFQSFPAGVNLALNTLKGYVSDMQYVFTKEGAQSVGSFFTIGSLFPAQFDGRVFWQMTAFLSIILAFMNILPIPALDGGHVFFLLVEVITRRKPSDKFLEYAQMVGMFLLIALMALALSNDIRRFFF
ncbi:MAG: RIP metalloprotease RseP [Bacteroidales bacterium]|nr:RIP metalloprotease RseP [Bacteroidales bacterium]